MLEEMDTFDGAYTTDDEAVDLHLSTWVDQLFVESVYQYILQ